MKCKNPCHPFHPASKIYVLRRSLRSMYATHQPPAFQGSHGRYQATERLGGHLLTCDLSGDICEAEALAEPALPVSRIHIPHSDLFHSQDSSRGLTATMTYAASTYSLAGRLLTLSLESPESPCPRRFLFRIKPSRARSAICQPNCRCLQRK